MNDLILQHLVCPATQSRLDLLPDGNLRSSGDPSLTYQIISDIPCLTSANGLKNTHAGRLQIDDENSKQGDDLTDDEMDSFLEGMMVPTCGNAFRGWRKADPLPIPTIPSAFQGNVVVDVGCNWGRWSISLAQQGYQVIGVDVHLRSLLVAQRLCKRMSLPKPPLFVLADARKLPLKDGSVDGVFSYSVVQHFSRPHAENTLDEIGRILRIGGKATVQMPNRSGLRSQAVLAKRGYTEGEEFDVRYYQINDLLELFSQRIGITHWEVDCFFGLNLHWEDINRVRAFFRPLVVASALANVTSNRLPFLKRFADSVFLLSEKTVERSSI